MTSTPVENPTDLLVHDGDYNYFLQGTACKVGGAPANLSCSCEKLSENRGLPFPANRRVVHVRIDAPGLDLDVLSGRILIGVHSVLVSSAYLRASEPGVYPIQVRLEDSDGQLLSTRTLTLKVLA